MDNVLVDIINENIIDLKEALSRPESRKAVSYTHLTLPTNREV